MKMKTAVAVAFAAVVGVKDRLGNLLSLAVLVLAALIMMILNYDRQIHISWSLYLIGLLLSAILGILFILKIVLTISPKIMSVPEVPQLLEALYTLLNETLDDTNKKKGDISEAPVFSRNVDQEVRDILDKVINDYIMSWLQPLLEDAHSIKDIDMKLKRDMWIALKKLNERLSNIDKVQLLASDIIQRTTEHFSRLRLSMQEANKGIISWDQDLITSSFAKFLGN